MKSGSKHIQLKWRSVQNVKIILVTHWYHHELPPWSSSIMLISRCSTHKMLIWFHQHCLLLEVAPCCQYTITVLSPQLVQSLGYCIREHCLVSDSVVGIEWWWEGWYSVGGANVRERVIIHSTRRDIVMWHWLSIIQCSWNIVMWHWLSIIQCSWNIVMWHWLSIIQCSWNIVMWHWLSIIQCSWNIVMWHWLCITYYMVEYVWWRGYCTHRSVTQRSIV